MCPLFQTFRHSLHAHHPGHLLDGDGLGKVAREVHVKAFQHSKPVGNELQRDDVEDALEDINGAGNLNLKGLAGLEFLVAGIADDNGLATTSNDCKSSLES
jgi:hypothetical protein